jgi:hypothetical protein
MIGFPLLLRITGPITYALQKVQNEVSELRATAP